MATPDRNQFHPAISWVFFPIFLLLIYPYLILLGGIVELLGGSDSKIFANVVLCVGFLAYFFAWFAIPAILSQKARIQEEAPIMARQRAYVEDLLRSDDDKAQCRKFILYLRPFTMDGLLYWERDLTGIMDTGVAHATTLDEALFLHLKGEIPIICLDEKTRDLGAFTISSTDQTWLEQVLRLMRKAHGIVIVPGDTAGIVEELHLIWSTSELRSKSVIIMPPEYSGSFLELKWGQAQKCAKALGVNIPDYDPHGLAFTFEGGSMFLAYCAPSRICSFIENTFIASGVKLELPTDAMRNGFGESGFGEFKINLP